MDPQYVDYHVTTHMIYIGPHNCLDVHCIFQMCPHLAAISIHGDMAQERRSEILEGFREGKYSVIVATGILARGLDLKNVQQV